MASGCGVSSCHKFFKLCMTSTSVNILVRLMLKSCHYSYTGLVGYIVAAH